MAKAVLPSLSKAALTRNAAPFFQRLLRGAKPAELPVEQPSEFLLAVNMNVAKELGVTVPQSVMIRATTVIGQ